MKTGVSFTGIFLVAIVGSVCVKTLGGAVYDFGRELAYQDRLGELFAMTAGAFFMAFLPLIGLFVAMIHLIFDPKNSQQSSGSGAGNAESVPEVSKPTRRPPTAEELAAIRIAQAKLEAERERERESLMRERRNER